MGQPLGLPLNDRSQARPMDYLNLKLYQEFILLIIVKNERSLDSERLKAWSAYNKITK